MSSSFLRTRADVVVHLLHAGFVDAPVLAALLAHHRVVLRRQHGRDVHARRVVPDEERLVGLLRVVAVDEVDDLIRDLLVHGLGAIQRQRTLVTAHLVLARAIGGLARQDVARGRQTKGGLWIHGTGHFRDTGDRRVLAGRRNSLLERRLVDVGEAHLLHGVEVIQVAPVFLEAVCRRQGIGVIAQVVLAELAGGVAEIVQELRERRGAGPQVGRAARELRRDHAGAQRIHAGEEGIAPGGAALHSDIVHEDRAFVADAVDVRRLADHQPAVIDARLHPSDVVAHDEEDIGFLSLLGGGRNACHGRGGTQRGKSAPDWSEHAHGCFPQCRLPKPGPQPSPHSTRRPSLCIFAHTGSCFGCGRALRGPKGDRCASDTLCGFGRSQISLRAALQRG